MGRRCTRWIAERAEPQEILCGGEERRVFAVWAARRFPRTSSSRYPEGKHADIVILNGAECEPYLTADHRLMLESPERIVGRPSPDSPRDGRKAMGSIAIESEQAGCHSKSMQQAASAYPNIQILPLKTKYPQGSEKQLIHVVAGREVPRGKLPLDAGVLVFNVSTAAAVCDAVALGKPLVSSASRP